MDEKQVHSDEARRTLRTLLDDVEHRDEHVTIARYGKPAAVMVPVYWYEAARKALGGQIGDTQ